MAASSINKYMAASSINKYMAASSINKYMAASSINKVQLLTPAQQQLCLPRSSNQGMQQRCCS
jgi:hypothetical protein